MRHGERRHTKKPRLRLASVCVPTAASKRELTCLQTHTRTTDARICKLEVLPQEQGDKPNAPSLPSGEPGGLERKDPAWPASRNRLRKNLFSLASSHGIQSFPFARVPGPTASPASPASLASLAKPAQKTAFLRLLLLMGLHHFPLPVCPGTWPAQTPRTGTPASPARLAQKTAFLFLHLLIGLHRFPLHVYPGTRPAQPARPALPDWLKKHLLFSCPFSWVRGQPSQPGQPRTQAHLSCMFVRIVLGRHHGKAKVQADEQEI